MTLTRVLIAEDDESIIALEKRILEDAGYSVDCAVSGDQALQMAKDNRYAVIVADVMMPGMDGIDLTREIAKIYQRSVPVLLVTAMSDVLKTAHSREAKPMSCLQKPFTPQALLTAVRLLEAQSKSGNGDKKEVRPNGTPSVRPLKPTASKPVASKPAVSKPAVSRPVLKSAAASDPSKKKKSWLEKLLSSE
jgi:DNA-binding response OmpR family regulator